MCWALCQKVAICALSPASQIWQVSYYPQFTSKEMESERLEVIHASLHRTLGQDLRSAGLSHYAMVPLYFSFLVCKMGILVIIGNSVSCP